MGKYIVKCTHFKIKSNQNHNTCISQYWSQHNAVCKNCNFELIKLSYLFIFYLFIFIFLHTFNVMYQVI